ncbi:MAG TPA: class I SAM-dependent methyltransferase [Acidiphilium sp.]
MESSFPATSMPDRDWWAALWPDPAATLRQIGIATGMAVLDLCCGDGYFTSALAKLTGGRVQALDLDPAMLEQAKAEAERQGVSVTRWIRTDARDLAGCIDVPVDCVLIANTFHGVPDQAGLARAVRTVLRPGGIFAIINWHRLDRETTTVLGKPRGPATAMRMTPDAVGAVVEPEGFTKTAIVELPPYHYGIVFRTPALSREP